MQPFCFIFGLYYKLLYIYRKLRTMEKEKELTSAESLEIITRMIHQAKGNAQEGSFYFLFWGWIAVIASLGHFYLEQFTEFPHPYMVWLIAIPGWIITMIYGYKQSGKKRVKTYSDGLIMWTWISFLFSILVVIFAGSYLNFHITALILLFSGMATFITGLIIRFNPLVIGGSSFWIFAPMAIYLGVAYAPLVMAIAVIVGYLIPGYLLKKA